MLTAATADVSSLSWWQALVAAGSLALASLVAGVIVILGRRTFVGSSRPSRRSAARPKRGLVGRRAAAQATQAAEAAAGVAHAAAQSAQAAQAAAGVAHAAAQAAQAAQSPKPAQARQPDPGTDQATQPEDHPAADQAVPPEAHSAAGQAAPTTAPGGPPADGQPPSGTATAQAAQPPATPADQSKQTDGDFIRSWIAITLVIALIFFCAFAFSLNDSSLQSTLIGGLIASVGTAVAFYFSSKSSDKARQDIINAAGVGNELVPSLAGKTKTDAAQMLGQMSFSLIEDPNAPSKSPTAVIKTQHPLANTSAPRGSSIVVTFG